MTEDVFNGADTLSTNYGANEIETLENSNFSSYEALPNPQMHEEMIRTLSDMARGLDPRTVTHALLANRKTALAAEEISAITGKSPMDVDRTVAILEEYGWVIHFQEHGFDKYIIRGVVRD